jgi:predicted dehydrogenase
MLTRRTFLQNASMAAAGAAVAPVVRAAAGGVARAAPPIRVAQIGTAHAHAAEKWEALKRFPELFSVAGIHEPDSAQRARASGRREYAGARWLTEEELEGDGTIQAVVVETELPDLLAVSRRCVERGWHVHIDKPPGTDLAGFVALQQRAAQQKRVLQTGYMYRYHPAVRFCLDAVRQGWLGRVFAIHGDIGKAIAAARRPWLAENYGGSTLLLGCHLLDLAVAVLGRPDRVQAFRRRTFPERDTFFDNETVILEYPNALATIRSMLAEVEGEGRRQFALFGENGTVEILPLEPARVRLALEKPAGGFRAGWQEVTVPPVGGRYDAQMKDFAGMIGGAASTAPEFTPGHERIVHAALLEATPLRPAGLTATEPPGGAAGRRRKTKE